MATFCLIIDASCILLPAPGHKLLQYNMLSVKHYFEFYLFSITNIFDIFHEKFMNSTLVFLSDVNLLLVFVNYTDYIIILLLVDFLVTHRFDFRERKLFLKRRQMEES